VKKKKTAVLVVVVIIIMGLTVSCGANSESVIIVAGSTSVQPYAEILAEVYDAFYHDGIIDVQGGGSSAGIQAVGSGIADIGMSSRSLKDSEKESLQAIEIAKDVLVIITHPDNPVKNLSIENIRDIYTGNINTWNTLGGAEKKIHVVTREEGSGTRSAFEELVMDGLRITPEAIVLNFNGAIRQLVANDKYSIGFISLGLINETIYSVNINGYEPTRENIEAGNYNLYRAFLFVTAGEPEGAAKEFIDFTLSPEGQQILINEGLIPN